MAEAAGKAAEHNRGALATDGAKIGSSVSPAFGTLKRAHHRPARLPTAMLTHDLPPAAQPEVNGDDGIPSGAVSPEEEDAAASREALLARRVIRLPYGAALRHTVEEAQAAALRALTPGESQLQACFSV